MPGICLRFDIPDYCLIFSWDQGGDSAAGTQALPVGKIIDDKLCRKDNQKGIANLHMLKDNWKSST